MKIESILDASIMSLFDVVEVTSEQIMESDELVQLGGMTSFVNLTLNECMVEMKVDFSQTCSRILSEHLVSGDTDMNSDICVISNFRKMFEDSLDDAKTCIKNAVKDMVKNGMKKEVSAGIYIHSDMLPFFSNLKNIVINKYLSEINVIETDLWYFKNIVLVTNSEYKAGKLYYSLDQSTNEEGSAMLTVTYGYKFNQI